MCGQHNIRATAAPILWIGIKVPDPAGNGTRAAGLEGWESTDHTTATDDLEHTLEKS